MFLNQAKDNRKDLLEWPCCRFPWDPFFPLSFLLVCYYPLFRMTSGDMRVEGIMHRDMHNLLREKKKGLGKRVPYTRQEIIPRRDHHKR